MTDTEETRRLLLQSSDVYRQLTSDHHTLDDRLRLLAGKSHLTDDEQLEEVRLKKEKLRLKDQMEAIVRRHQAPVSTRPN
ncbi:MAG: YdcH family protein [Acidobacteria bacterium]|nr:YdcH family protein [Acidobacteriota bacterium]